MRRATTSLFGAVVAIASAFAVAVLAAAAGGEDASKDPARLVFLLEYIGNDYGTAVRDEVVVDQAEYGEVLRFLKEVTKGYEAKKGRDATSAGLRQLETLIGKRVPPEQVWTATRKLLPAVAKLAGADARPPAVPNLARGRRLWTNDCTPCHGPSGAGDGPASTGMTPPPTPFRGEWLERLAPRQTYNALTFGVDGTAMPSFTAAYTPQQRWDVAFYLPTLRVDFDPKRPVKATAVSVDDLAVSSNTELLARLRKTQPEAGPNEVDWLRVNLPMPAPAAGGTPAGSIGVAIQMQDVFAGVAERVMPRVVGVRGYVRDAEWSPEALRARHGDGWIAENPDAVRYAGFRPVRGGSGFLVDDQGYLLSCDHLMRDERGELVQFVDVELQDQSHHAARVVGAEPMLDLAVLQVAEPNRLGDVATELDAGDSDRLQLGQWLIALGDPPGPGKTFAVGLVSAPAERQCYQADISATRVQSSLVVPAGGLCGPVVDILGAVVGMSVRQAAATDTTALAADGPPATHVLPINLVLNLYEALRVAQSARSPWIGVSVLELPALRRKLGANAHTVPIPQTGLYIDDVFDPSPALRAGVRPGDFLLALGGHPMLSVGDFQTWLYVTGVGKSVELALQRDGAPVRVDATIEVRPEHATTR